MLGLLLVAGCDVTKGKYFGRIRQRADTRTLYFGNSAEPEFMDPARLTAVNDGKVADQCFDGLTELDPQTALPIPALAERWEVSPDWMHFTFHLRPGLKFSDGRALEAQDVVYSWARALHPAWAARDAEEFYKIDGGEEWNGGVLRHLRVASKKLAPGRVVVKEQASPRAAEPTDSGTRKPRARIEVRSDPRDDAKVLHRYGRSDDLIVFDESADGTWVHVWESVSLAGGWVRAAELVQPSADIVYVVEGMDGAQKGVRDFVRGKDLAVRASLLAVRARDATTLEIDLAKPTLFWLLQVADTTFRVVDRYTLDRLGAEWHRHAGDFVCSGAFCLTEWKLRDSLTLLKNPHYWDAARTRLDKIVVMSIDEQATATAVYFDGRVDMLTANSIPGSMLPKLNGSIDGKPKADYIRLPYLGTYFYVVNVDEKTGPPALKNRALRRALGLALDRRELPALLKSGIVPWTAKVPLGMEPFTGYKSPPGLDFDLVAARKELEQARRELGGKIPRITIRINTGVEQHQIIAEWVQGQWKKHLGLDIGLESQEWKTMLKALRQHDFDIMRMGGIASMPEPEDFVGDNYRKGSPNNQPGWSSDEYMALLEKQQHEPDRQKRNQYIYEMEKLVLDEGVNIPLYTYVQHHLVKPYVCNAPHNILDKIALKYVWIDFTYKCEGAAPRPTLEGQGSVTP